jgi:hypothetical protein
LADVFLRIAYLRGWRNAAWISKPQPLIDTAIAVVYFCTSDGAPEAWS